MALSTIPSIGGSLSSTFEGTKSVPASTDIIITEFKVPVGTWLVQGEIRYSEAGNRVFCHVGNSGKGLSTNLTGTCACTAAAAPSRICSTNVCVVTGSSNNTIRLMAYSNTANTVNNGFLRATRIA